MGKRFWDKSDKERSVDLGIPAGQIRYPFADLNADLSRGTYFVFDLKAPRRQPL